MKQRSKKYDAYYEDGKWLEPKCSDDTCEFCKDRPDNPPIEKKSKDINSL